MRSTIGFRANRNTNYPGVGGVPTEVAWLKVAARSKYPSDGAMINDPDRLDMYELEWNVWWDGLEARVGTMPGWLVARPSGKSVFDNGWITCSQFAIAPTLRAFLQGVTRALVYTPLFSLAAMLLFLGDVYLCYAALYTIVAIIVIVLGLLGFLGMSLGPIESLSFAIVIGVSVDYLVHFAYAFKHSLLLEQYYKTRAVLLARSGSTLASGLTTLCAVLPLVSASILPLRVFGIIFTVVALVSLGCAMLLFNALLMITGPGISMSVHSLPSNSTLPPIIARPVISSSTTSSAPGDEVEYGRCKSALLVGFGGQRVNEERDTGRSDMTSTTASGSTNRDAAGFQGFAAHGPVGLVKV